MYIEDMLAAAEVPPIDTRFTLGAEITPEQHAFFDCYGFLVFDGVATQPELDAMLADLDRIQADWLAQDRKKVNGIPIYWMEDPDGNPYVTRFTFTSMFSDAIRQFVLDARFEPIRRLVGEDARVGHDEKDGVVFNRYINGPKNSRPQLGWHTDGLRDLFYGRMPQAMFNVGLHFDAITAADGGLRLIPGTHQQGMWDMMFRKFYFTSHRPDVHEIAVETKPGDLTVHDGRLWHRVARSPRSGWSSLRRSMYVPYQTGPYERKTEDSKTPLYLKAAKVSHFFKKLM
jgi:phytanoyl-CoA hydroxylase